jgi:hypothetical protein
VTPLTVVLLARNLNAGKQAADIQAEVQAFRADILHPLRRALAKPIAGRRDDVAIAASNFGSATERDHQWAALD